MFFLHCGLCRYFRASQKFRKRKGSRCPETQNAATRKRSFPWDVDSEAKATHLPNPPCSCDAFTVHLRAALTAVDSMAWKNDSEKVSTFFPSFRVSQAACLKSQPRPQGAAGSPSLASSLGSVQNKDSDGCKGKESLPSKNMSLGNIMFKLVVFQKMK